MTIHTTRTNVSRLDVISTGARRRWTIEEKQRIVAESFAVPRNVSATARHYGLAASQLFYWRQMARQGKTFAPSDGPAFVPALGGVGYGHASTAASMAGRMEIVLSSSHRLVVGRDVDGAALRRVLDVLERS